MIIYPFPSNFISDATLIFNDWLVLVGRNQKERPMADKQTPEDKAAAFREYQEQQQSIMERTAVLRFERLQREASGENAPPPKNRHCRVVGARCGIVRD